MNSTAKITSEWSKVLSRLRLPIIAAPMFLISGPRLVVAACRAGIVGAFPTQYARTSEDLRTWLEEIQSGLASEGGGNHAPYAATIIVHPTNPRVDADVDLMCEFKVPIVIGSVGNAGRIVDRIHSYGGIVLTDIAKVSHARKAVESGVDGLILLCAGAGGHTGSLNPFGFVQAVRSFYAGPIGLAGSIGNGRAIRAAQALGADFAYMGTRFIAARESDACADYRTMIAEADADQVILTSSITGIPANWLAGSLKRLGYDDHQGTLPGDFDVGVHIKAWRDLWGAGHGVGTTSKVESVEEIVATLEGEYKNAGC
jgi:Dioxygenases related to 2-nitropropane dioxygenase